MINPPAPLFRSLLRLPRVQILTPCINPAIRNYHPRVHSNWDFGRSSRLSLATHSPRLKEREKAPPLHLRSPLGLLRVQMLTPGITLGDRKHHPQGHSSYSFSRSPKLSSCKTLASSILMRKFSWSGHFLLPRDRFAPECSHLLLTAGTQSNLPRGF